MIHDLTVMLHTPLFWGKVACSIIILLLVVASIRRFSPNRNMTNFGKSTAPEVTVKVVSPTTAPKKATSAPAPSSNLLKTGIKLLLWVGAFALIVWIGQPIWKGVYTYFTTDHTPSVQSAAGMVQRQEEAASAAPAECTAPAQTATVVGGETVWIEVAKHCQAHPDPPLASGTYGLSCRDLKGVEHEWNDNDCWNYTALGFKKLEAEEEPDPVPSSKPLVIHISFTTVP